MPRRPCWKCPLGDGAPQHRYFLEGELTTSQALSVALTALEMSVTSAKAGGSRERKTERLAELRQ